MKKSELKQIIREEIYRLLEHKWTWDSFVKDGHKYTIQSVDDNRFLHVKDERGNRKTFDLKFLQKHGIYDPTKKVKTKKITMWNEKLYQKWIKDSASGGGARNAFDMAQNAKYEPGLLDYVKKKIRRNYGDETPLERIQWDIENYA